LSPEEKMSSDVKSSVDRVAWAGHNSKPET
jgi:hypothetical protein